MAFPGRPDARYRPLTLWWWSGEPVERERMLWQVEQMAAIGCGGFVTTGLAMHGPSAGSRADEPRALTPEWFDLLRTACVRAAELGMGVGAWSPMQVGQAHDIDATLAARPDLRGELVVEDGEVIPYGVDYGNRDALAALTAPGTKCATYLDGIRELVGDQMVALFEDEFPGFPRWAPTFAAEFRDRYGYDVPLAALTTDIGASTPAVRCQVLDLAVERVVSAYTAWQTDLVDRTGVLAGYDQCGRQGVPVLNSAYYYDPFRTMAWANAHGTDHMGDARFALSQNDLGGGARTWLEGFHSQGYGMTLDDQVRLLLEWSREGVSLFLPHGGYYATRALWWEWAPPEMGWRQPYARHYPAFADFVGRLMSWSSAGDHRPDVAVLYPMSSVWAGMTGLLTWDDEAMESDRAWVSVFGTKGVPSGWDLERPHHASPLAEAGYDRIAVDEFHVDIGLPVVLPGCRVLRTSTLQKLVDLAEAGRPVVVLEPAPAWSFENGRDDPTFTKLVDRLRVVAAFVTDPAEVTRYLPPPRIEGGQAQWRRVGDLDVVAIGAHGQVRLRAYADRAPEVWDPLTGGIAPYPATVDGDDLLLTVDSNALLLSLPTGTPVAPTESAYDVVLLPEIWECEFLEWGENRWGDYRLPANDGTPPVERRTFAFREGDDPAWQRAPVTPEEADHPHVELGFEDRMRDKNGRPAPADRVLPDGWHEVVSTYGPHAVVDGRRLAEYSERLGIEDALLTTPIGLKGRVEPWKVDLGESGGQVTSWGWVPADADTHLVVEGSAVVTVWLDGTLVAGPVDAGVVAVPVSLTAGWHEVCIEATRRTLGPNMLEGWRPGPRVRLTWSFGQPYERPVGGIWGGKPVHPDYKGAPGPMRFRRALSLPRDAMVSVLATAPGGVEHAIPPRLAAGEHVLELVAGRSMASPQLQVALTLRMGTTTVTLGSDDLWEYQKPDGTWTGAFTISEAGSISWTAEENSPPAVPRCHALTDVAWLEGSEVLAGLLPGQRWSDSPDPPPPAWFCFTAPPGARSVTLPVAGEVRAWVDGEPVSVRDERLTLHEHARVALRVQAPAGYRGAACFREHPLFELGDGTIVAGRSWHQQGLDCFSGVILHRACVTATAGPAVLDLGDVRGSVAVTVNGVPAGVLFSRPWTLPVTLEDGDNVIELEVANTLGPLAGRGIPTPFGPEEQRVSGLLARPRLLF